MRKQRPSLTDVANLVGQIGQGSAADEERSDVSPAPAAPAAPDRDQANVATASAEEQEPYWKKATATYRTDQLNQLDHMLAQWNAEKRVKMSAAEVLRLALDAILKRMEEDPDQVILELHLQEQSELGQAQTRKFGRSKGAEAYLRRKGKL